MSRLIRIFSLAYSFAFILTFLICIFFYTWKKALILAAIIGPLYGLFALGFMVRQLRRITFVINSSNKATDKGLSWYQERMEEQARDMRFQLVKKTQEQIIYKPQSLYKVFESKIVIDLSPYDIQISCSRMMMRIILDYVDLQYEDNA